jgi:hypothetical protein
MMIEINAEDFDFLLGLLREVAAGCSPSSSSETKSFLHVEWFVVKIESDTN